MADGFLKCRYADHQSKEIESLCVNKKCEKMKPACLDCLRYFHQNHMDDVIDFTQFNNIQKDYAKMIEQIKGLIRDVEFMIPILKQLLIDHSFENKGQLNDLNIQQLNDLVCKIIPWVEIHQLLSIDLGQFHSQVAQLKSKLKKIKHQNEVKQQVIDNKSNQEECLNKDKDKKSANQICTKINLHQTINFQHVSEVSQLEQCNAMAFNQHSTIMIAACEISIKVFAFEQERLKQIQLIKQHKSVINSLQFFKQQDQFISASNDKEIILWGLKNGKQQEFEMLQSFVDGHNNWVYCIILNKAENLIISGSDDKTIKFWSKFEKWKCVQTLSEHTGYVNSLSLNSSEQQLVSCGGDNLILISQEENKQWKVIHKVKVSVYGSKVLFIDNDTFLFQPNSGEKMRIYEFNKSKQLYVKMNGLKLKKSKYEQALFPSLFNTDNQMLLHRFGEVIYFIKRKNQTEFIIQQSILFGTDCVYGTISQDWQYLVTWDQKSQQFQVRKNQV